MKKILLLAVIVASARISSGSVMFDPGLEWKSVRTEHFWIHYHEGLEDAARRMCVIAESVHARLVRDIGWTPHFRTDVVLVDNMDMSNGFAMPFPHNRVQIYISRPELDDVLNNFNDWLELVFLHEYVHILNIDTIHGLPALSRYTVGRCCFPNMFLPIWQLEGNAVYHESKNSRYGRNNSTYTDMVIRGEIAAGTFKSLSEASHFPRRWPTGSVPYLYGGLFVEFLEEKYGRDSFARVMNENADNIVPYLVHYNARQVYGKNFGALWREWRGELGRNYQKQIDRIKSETLTACEKISKSGHRTSLPRFHPDGKSLYYVRLTNYDSPALMRYSLLSKRDGALCAVHYPGSLAVTSTGRAYLSDLEMHKTFSLYSEMFMFNGSYERLSRRLRVLYLDVSKDGDEAVFVKQDANSYWLIRQNLVSGKTFTIIDKTDIQLAHPRLSPDRKKVVFIMKDRSGNSDLVLHDPGKSGFIRLTADIFNDIQPTWHPDGTRILFSSDRTGVYNLYELSMTHTRLTRMTNLLGGAFSPDISPDGNAIAFSSYDHEGFNIALMSYPGAGLDQTPASPTILNAGFFTAPFSDNSVPLDTRPYSIWNSVLPTAWIPVYFTQEVYEGKNDSAIGLATMGGDTLYRYSYYLMAYALTFEKRATVDAQLAISPLYPDILISYFDETLFYGADEFPWAGQSEYTVKRTLEKNGAVGIAFPFLYFRSQHLILLACEYEQAHTDMQVPGFLPQRQVDTLSYTRAAYSYNNAREYAYSISGEDGRSFFIIYDHFMTGLGSDYQFYKIRSEYAEYLPGPWRNNVFMLRLRSGIAMYVPEHLLPYNIGRFEKGSGGSPPDDEDAFGMRGYPSGGFYGNRLAVAAAEYRFPLFQADLGYSTMPIMFRDIWIALFAEYGNVWNGAAQAGDFRTAAGAELHMKITLGYYLDLAGFIGYARGFGDYGESQVYFGVSTLYEGAAKNRNKWFDFL
jgi:hypothetical protein